MKCSHQRHNYLPGIYLAGDEQLNGSLNAAMIAGERAALAIIESITNFKQ